MAGIYIHIPFCRQACNYCNFHFTTSLLKKNDLVAAICKEAVLRKNEIRETVQTIYLGGGTPSLLSSAEIDQVFKSIRLHYDISPGAEITLEANPDDINEESLLCWKKAGINRLSIGVQSFFDEDLVWMNRAHNSDQALKAVQLALCSFPNITIDLIYGVPGLTNERWLENVRTAISLDIPHLSCYALTVEPKTPLDKQIRQQRKTDVDTDQQADQFVLLMDWLGGAGYEHYEISNFAKPGMRSRHNSAYWQGKPYIGLGPAAHSYNGNGLRQWNISNNQQYISMLNDGQIQYDQEILTPVQQANEYIMTSLRTKEGMRPDFFSEEQQNKLLQLLENYIKEGAVNYDGTTVTLTRKGKLLADGIAADLFFD